MKLDAQTLSILRNFAAINPSVQFKKGSVIRTVSPNKTILAKATLPSEIESTFAIYDLSRFLGVLSMFKEPLVELQDAKLNIKSDGRQVSYTYADPSIMVLPPEKDLDIGPATVEFDLSESQLTEIVKALGIMSFPDIAVVGEGGKLKLRATDTKNPSSDKYDIDVGTTGKEFLAIIKSENFKLIPANYRVSLSDRQISHFASDLVEYWIPLESHSSF